MKILHSSNKKWELQVSSIELCLIRLVLQDRYDLWQGMSEVPPAGHRRIGEMLDAIDAAEKELAKKG